MSITAGKIWQSYVLVGIQFVCLGLIVMTGPILASSWIFLGLELLGLALGLWALVVMNLRNLHVLPEVYPESTLVTHGPYRYIRHPMYSTLLLVTLALVLDAFSPERLLMWMLLFGDLWIKLRYEEQLLTHHFQDYQDYQRRTKRLIPFLI